MTLFIICLFVIITCVCCEQYFEEAICPNTWREYNGSCYRLISESVSWATAEDNCKAWPHGHLVNIRDDGEQNFLKNMATTAGQSKPIWIGYKKDKYQWTDGSKLDYEYWYQHYRNDRKQPRSYGYSTAFAYLHKENGNNWNWYDTRSASNSHLPLCKMKKLSAECPDNSYWEWGEYCYRLLAVLQYFHEAEQLCRKQTPSSSLASIHSAAEMAFLKSKLSSHATRNVWIGLMLAGKPFTYEWSDVQMNGSHYVNWIASYSANSNPDLSYTGALCSRMDNAQSWRWSVVSCKGTTAYYICESDNMVPIATYGNECKSTSTVSTPTVNSSDSEILEEMCTIDAKCIRQYMSVDLFLMLIAIILGVEAILIFLVILVICCIKRKNHRVEMDVKRSKNSVVFTKDILDDKKHFNKLNNETGGDFAACNQSAAGVKLLPIIPKGNPYADYKTKGQEYENNVNIKDEVEASHCPDVGVDEDEYEELPAQEDYTVPLN